MLAFRDSGIEGGEGRGRRRATWGLKGYCQEGKGFFDAIVDEPLESGEDSNHDDPGS